MPHGDESYANSIYDDMGHFAEQQRQSELEKLRAENAALRIQVEEKNKENAHLSGVIDDAVDDIERLETALRRLASPEAFVVSRVATEEETARMRFASDALKAAVTSDERA